MMRDVLIAAEEEHGEACMAHCFEEAAKSSDGRRTWSYVEKILKRHAIEGCSPQDRSNFAAAGMKSYRYDD